MKHIYILFLVLAGVCFDLQAKKQSPNVIYILADDLGYGDLSCYGQKKIKTPNIDKLASEGMKFTQHYSGNTVCSPSRAGLMTGLHPGVNYIRGNVGDERMAAPAKELTILPEVFKAAGYSTGAFGKWGLGVTHSKDIQNPLQQGFDKYSGWESQMIAHTYYPSHIVRDGKKIPLKEGTYVHDEIMQDAFDFIEDNAKSKKPFFCYIPTAIPHAAMHAPKELHEKWRKVFPQFDNVTGNYSAGKGEKCPKVINPVAGFAGMMEHLDNNVGTILELLKKYKIDDNTLVIFSSDNGAHAEGGHKYQFWNSTGSLRGMKRDMHEGGIRVPMLARWPKKIKEGTISNHISAFWDVLPTMCELVGQKIPTQNSGISFLHALENKGINKKEHDYLYFEFTKSSKGIVSRAVRMGKWKGFMEEAKQKIELYDLEKDPYEKTDISAQHPEIVAKIKAVIKEAHHDLPASKVAAKTNNKHHNKH